MINQGVARAFARVRRPGVLTFAVVSEVGVSGRRVDGGHSLNYVGKRTCGCRMSLYDSTRFDYGLRASRGGRRGALVVYALYS